MQDLDKSDEQHATSQTAGLDGRAERIFMTSTGQVLVIGWLADEGLSKPQFGLHCDDVAIPCDIYVMRYRRPDVEERFGSVDHEFGYFLLGQYDASAQPKPEHLYCAVGELGISLPIEVRQVSPRALLQHLLSFIAHFETFGGREVSLHAFLADGARLVLANLYRLDQSRARRVIATKGFGLHRAGPSFVTVLFGSANPIAYQPILFAKAGIAFGEWIYVCNSPELAERAIMVAESTSKLYDLPIRIIVCADNCGFGSANNLAVSSASSAHISLINPDVYCFESAANGFNAAMRPERFGNALRGGLLFYDESTLMHGGMFLDEDLFVASGRFAQADNAVPRSCRLLRVEHYDKGVPFRPASWSSSRKVAAVTGAFMAFERTRFEAASGFSDDFLYGHYEDADLCLRWADRIGPVEVDKDLRLLHLEGLGSKARSPHFYGATIVNRHTFERRNRRFVDADRHGEPLGWQIG